jgi:CRISPR-associated protein Cas2
MIVIVASGVMDRVHGFLRSVMLNPHPGVYLSSQLDAGARKRVWEIVSGWHKEDPRGTMLLMYQDKKMPMEIRMESVGSPKREIQEDDGHYVLVASRKNEEDCK